MKQWALVPIYDEEPGYPVLPRATQQEIDRATALLAVANEFCDEYGYCVPPDEGCGTPTCDALRALAATGDWWKRPPTGEE